MFYGCTSLQYLSVKGFQTDMVYDMSYMFGHCSNLTYLDLSSFNTEECDDIEGIFDECYNLTVLINQYECSNIVEEVPDYIRVIFTDDFDFNI